MTEKVNSAKAKAARKAHREAKQERGEFQPRANVRANVRFALVRDQQGRPKFDRDPRTMAPAEIAACKRLMNEAERKEFFDDPTDERT